MVGPSEMYLEDAIRHVRKHTWSGAIWTTGGCGILAEAIKMIFPSAQYIEIFDPKAGLTAHVGAKIGDFVYDADGKALPMHWLNDWIAWTANPNLKLMYFSSEDWPDDIERDRGQSRYIAKLLKKWHPTIES